MLKQLQMNIQKNDSKIVALKNLDRKAKQTAEIFAYSNGIIMTLVFGLEMCLAMKVIDNSFALGIIIGIIGIIGIVINYPIYNAKIWNT